MKAYGGSLVCLIVLVIALNACGTAGTPFDPSLAARDAQYQAERYGLMVTGTVQAQIVPITQTAAAQQIASTSTAQALAYQQQLWTATAQSVQSTQTAAMTQTAMSWTPTPNYTMTVAVAQAQAQAEQVRLETQRAEINNVFRSIFWYGSGIVVLFLLVAFAFNEIKRRSYLPQPMNEQGKPQPMVNVLDAIFIDSDRMPNYRGDFNDSLSKVFIEALRKKLGVGQQLPEITATRQAEVTTLAQRTDLATRAKLPMSLWKELHQPQQPVALLPETVKPLDTNFRLPSWDLMKSWDSKDGIPYYTARGMEMVNEKQYPHLAAIGATGAGKSRRFFRPVITCALAQGHRVVIIGKSTDYWPFEGHPNAHLFKVSKITESGQAERYEQILEAIIAEMNRRDDVLTAARKSTWAEMGLSQTFIVLDELGNALRMMDRPTAIQCRTWIEGLISESRKMGFRMMIANQRATGMASILSQAGKAVFRIEQDEERHHHSLAGASVLADGYYIARLGQAWQVAGAFEPTDEEIRQFLASHPVNKVDDDENGWIDAIATDVPANLAEGKQDLIEGPAEIKERKPNSVEDFLKSLSEQEYKIIDMHLAKKSQAEICRELFGSTGGSAYYKVSDIIRRYKAANTSTSTPVSPKLSPSPA